MSEQPVFVRGWMPPWGVEALRQVFAALFWLLARVQVKGLKNLPASGGLILSSNHLSRLDAPLVFLLLKGRTVAAFAGDTYRARPFFRVILESVNCIWVRRGAIGPSTIRAAIQVLRAGHVLGVAPEGTRSPTRALQPGKTGAVFLAVSAGVPIVPIAITGTEKAVEVFTLRRPRLTVTVGQPITFTLPTGGRRPDAQILEDHTAELMCRIAAMLPPEYRGVYAEHPRLKELLGDESHPPPPAPPPSPRPRAEERGAGG